MAEGTDDGVVVTPPSSSQESFLSQEVLDATELSLDGHHSQEDAMDLLAFHNDEPLVGLNNSKSQAILSVEWNKATNAQDKQELMEELWKVLCNMAARLKEGEGNNPI